MCDANWKRMMLQATDVSVQLYALVHWEDPMDVTVGHQGGPYMPGENTHTKEGVLHYKAGTSYLGKENWKSCYLVLRYTVTLSTHCFKTPRKNRAVDTSQNILEAFSLGVNTGAPQKICV